MAFTRESLGRGSLCVIWVDDMIDIFTWRDTFGLRIQTPNIDRFMAGAARFANTYATVPLCAPCRSELATGISPFRSGLLDLNRHWNDVMPPEKAWAFDLRRAGFHTFTTGKVDATYRPMEESARRLLFHENPAASDRGGRKGIKVYLEGGPGIIGVNHPDDDGSQDDRFYDYQVAQNAIDHVRTADPARRHLIQLGFKHPHYNLACPDRFYQLYDPDDVVWPAIAAPEDYFGPQPGFAVYEAAYIANGAWIPEKAGDNAWRQVVRGYFAAISHVDHEIGRFLDALEQSPIGAATCVILLSDNGFNLGNHDSFHKMSQWDSAAHVPLGIRHPAMTEGMRIDMPVSLHNLPKTIMELAGLPPRPDWTSGQSLLPLIDPSFGSYDESQSPITSVFGTLSVRPSIEGYRHLRYFRYPNGEEHVYDLDADPGETRNLVETAPMDLLRRELTEGALRLGLDLRGNDRPDASARAMMAVGRDQLMQGTTGDTQYWAYGADAERIRAMPGSEGDRLWYMAGPDDHVLQAPAHVKGLRIATVVSRKEAEPGTGKIIRIMAHADTPLDFEASERVTVDLTGSDRGDVLIGSKFGGATFRGGAGNDRMEARTKMQTHSNAFFGGAGNDTLIGGPGRDTLDGGTGDDVIHGGTGRNTIRGGHGNDIIFDGPGGGSRIDPGPGRNRVTLVEGAARLHLGTGVNDIEPGLGAVRFRITWGGVTIIRRWQPEQLIELIDWPGEPRIFVHAPGILRIQLGLSIVEVHGIDDPATLRAQVSAAASEERRRR